MSEKGKGVKVSIEYNRANFSSVENELRFNKVAEINENFIIERSLEFELRQDYHFEWLTNFIVALD